MNGIETTKKTNGKRVKNLPDDDDTNRRIELEERVVGSLLAGGLKPSQLSPSLFAFPEFRAIYSACRDVDAQGLDHTNLVFVGDKLKEEHSSSFVSDIRRISKEIYAKLHFYSAHGKYNLDQLKKHIESESTTRNDGQRWALDRESGRTDAANAKRFIDMFQHELRYVAAWKKWLTWDQTRWVDDNGIGISQRAKAYADSLWMELASVAPHVKGDELRTIQSFIKSTNQNNAIKNFVDLAASDQRVVCHVEQLNSDPFLLNVLNCTIDLRNGEARPHSQADLITHLAPVEFDESALCPLWQSTVSMIFDDDAETIDYVQSILGYCTSGDIGEHILPIPYGSGCNGKSTIWNVVEALLGDYACTANESLLLGEGNSHPTEKAALYQKRFVAISEPDRGSKLREARVKELTGDATITARRMKEDFWSFKRTHKFWLSTNHLPKIEGADEGIWRRVKLIPFKVNLKTRVKKIIPNMIEKLTEEEGSGILNWLLAGWQMYQQHGFIEPETVKRATAEYRVDSDVFGEWISDNCVVESGAIATAKELYQRYQDTGGRWSATAFGRNMAERFEKDKPTSGEYRRQTIYRGLRLVNPSNLDFAQNHENYDFPGENTVCH